MTSMSHFVIAINDLMCLINAAPISRVAIRSDTTEIDKQNHRLTWVPYSLLYLSCLLLITYYCQGYSEITNKSLVYYALKLYTMLRQT